MYMIQAFAALREVFWSSSEAVFEAKNTFFLLDSRVKLCLLNYFGFNFIIPSPFLFILRFWPVGIIFGPFSHMNFRDFSKSAETFQQYFQRRINISAEIWTFNSWAEKCWIWDSLLWKAQSEILPHLILAISFFTQAWSW